MGNNPSTLSPNTLLALKKFRIFEEFPQDRNKADTIIANQATNALKHVNCNFASRIGGHRKRYCLHGRPNAKEGGGCNRRGNIWERRMAYQVGSQDQVHKKAKKAGEQKPL